MATPSGDVLFVGSVPLSSSEEVFTTISTALKGRVYQIPDGETGSRDNWIACQYSVFSGQMLLPERGGQPPDDQTTLNAKLSDIGPVGYDDWAIASFKEFESLQKSGKILPDVRFQVSVPSAFAVVQAFVKKNFCAEVEPLYEEKLLAAVRRLQREIPHEKLFLQLDLPIEIGALEYDAGRISDAYWQAWFPNVKQGVMDRLTRLVSAVEKDVPMGIHLCYGDVNHSHFVEPADTGLMVDFMNTLDKNIESIHHIDYIHIPVPKSRTDAAYFQPLENLHLHQDTKMYFGVIHANDEQGSKTRLDAARAVYRGPYGVSTECGLGRTPKEELESIISISQTLAST